MAKEELESGKEFLMKIFAVNTKDEITLMVFADYNPDDKVRMLKGLGLKMSDTILDLKELVLVSDTYCLVQEKFIGTDKIVYDMLLAGMKKGLRLQDLSPKFHKFRSEALIVISVGKDALVRMKTFPYVRIGKVIEFKEESLGPDTFEDNMLRYVWDGYNKKL